MKKWEPSEDYMLDMALHWFPNEKRVITSRSGLERNPAEKARMLLYNSALVKHWFEEHPEENIRVSAMQSICTLCEMVIEVLDWFYYRDVVPPKLTNVEKFVRFVRACLWESADRRPDITLSKTAELIYLKIRKMD